MRRALQLAKTATGKTFPNPLAWCPSARCTLATCSPGNVLRRCAAPAAQVGCVIVKNGQACHRPTPALGVRSGAQRTTLYRLGPDR